MTLVCRRGRTSCALALTFAHAGSSSRPQQLLRQRVRLSEPHRARISECFCPCPAAATVGPFTLGVGLLAAEPVPQVPRPGPPGGSSKALWPQPRLECGPHSQVHHGAWPPGQDPAAHRRSSLLGVQERGRLLRLQGREARVRMGCCDPASIRRAPSPRAPSSSPHLLLSPLLLLSPPGSTKSRRRSTRRSKLPSWASSRSATSAASCSSCLACATRSSTLPATRRTWIA